MRSDVRMLVLVVCLAGCGIEESDLVGTYDCKGCPTKEVLELHEDHSLTWKVTKAGMSKACEYQGNWIYWTVADEPTLALQGLEPTDTSCMVSEEKVDRTDSWQSVIKPSFKKATFWPVGESRIEFVQR
jgi:hypothetical protein